MTFNVDLGSWGPVLQFIKSSKAKTFGNVNIDIWSRNSTTQYKRKQITECEYFDKSMLWYGVECNNDVVIDILAQYMYIIVGFKKKNIYTQLYWNVNIWKLCSYFIFSSFLNYQNSPAAVVFKLKRSMSLGLKCIHGQENWYENRMMKT